MFNKIKGNRPLDERHVLELMRSFQVKHMYKPILVTKDLEVIDGQHTLEACRRLDIEVDVDQYLDNGITLTDVQLLNTHNHNWKRMSYLHSNCELGNPSYLRLREFMVNYPEFQIGTAISIIGDISGAGNTKDFKDGKFEITDIKKSYDNVAKIMEYKQFYKHYNNTWFVRTLIGLFRHPKFDHERMIKKIALQPTALVLCATVKQYKQLLQEIYNYKTRPDDRVDFTVVKYNAKPKKRKK
jgi:hypothetical protein